VIPIGVVRLIARTTLLVGLVCLPSAGRADDKAAPSVIVRTVDEQAVSGRLASFGLTGELVLSASGAGETRVPVADAVQIDLKGDRRPTASDAIRWELADGSAVYAVLVGASERAVTLRRGDLGTFDVSVDRIRRFTPPAGRAASVASSRPSSRPGGRVDELRLANGDRLSGLITRISPEGVTLETDDGDTTVGLDVVILARLASAGPATTPTPGDRAIRARLTLRDGSILTATDITWREGAFAVAIDTGPKRIDRQLDAADVSRIEVVGGRWRWVSPMRPVVAEHTPLLDVRWPHRVDRNVLGGDMRVGGRRFERGIGVHSRSRLVYALDDRAARFVTGYALDDDSGPMAHVDVTVLLNDKVVHRASDVRADGRIHRVSVDVNGGGRLELRVDYGKNGDVQDRFDWIEPAVILR